jgi:hypothetical protein
MVFHNLVTNHSATTMWILGRDDVDRDEALSTPKMVPTKPNNEVGSGDFAKVTESASSDVASMPDISRENILYFSKADSDLLMQCLLCVVGMALERTVGALGAPGTAAARYEDVFDTS